MNGEETDDFPPGGKACANHAAQQRQRSGNGFHTIASFAFEGMTARREKEAASFLFSLFAVYYKDQYEESGYGDAQTYVL